MDNITSIGEFDGVLRGPMSNLQETIEEQVPLTKDTPYRKRWWSRDLSDMRGVKERLARTSFRLLSDPQHAVHAEYQSYRNRYTDAIRLAKKDFWNAWIDSVNSKTIWDANCFLRSGASNGGSARIPPINATDGDGQPTCSNPTRTKARSSTRHSSSHQALHPYRRAPILP